MKLEYDYTADTYRPNRSKVAPTYAILNGTNFLFYVRGHTQDIPESLTLKLPDGWRIATGLPATADPEKFTAENYDVLVDCPALVGEFDSVTLNLRNVPHRLVVAPKGFVSEAVLRQYAADTLKVIDAQTQMFREIPYHDYTVINVFADRGSGALEHMNSYVSILPKGPATAEYLKNFLSDTAHEVFHLYNVKRIRPAEMFPYRYDERNYTPLLWVAEGITRYYESRGLLRAGLLNGDYLQQQARLLSSVEAAPAARYVSVEEASVSAWIGSSFTVDYYSRGAVLGLLLDLSIRHDTNGVASLDDVMRVLYYDFYKQGQGYTTFDLIAVINNLTKRDYGGFFKKYVSGTETLPYDEVLSYAGLRLEETKNKLPSLGFRTDDNNVITALAAGGAAETAGAKVGDVFLGIGNINSGQQPWVANYQRFYADKEDQTATMYLLRDRKPVYLDFKIRMESVSSWNLTMTAASDKLSREILSAWSTGG